MKIIFLLLLLLPLEVFGNTKSYLLIDAQNQQIIDSKNIENIVPMASITKLMTALVVLDSGVDLEEKITVIGKETSPRIQRGQKIKRIDLLNLSLVSSDNLAARSLAENHPGGYDMFITQMNSMAQRIGMKDTKFSDATGLIRDNVSTAWDIYLLTTETSKHPIFGHTAMTKVIEVYTEVKRKVKRILGMNTNSFAGQLQILSAKTGYTSQAGRCLTMMIEQNGKKYVVVVLGAKTPKERQETIKKLIVEYEKSNFVYNYQEFN